MTDTYFLTIKCPYCGEENPSEETKKEYLAMGMGIPYQDEFSNKYECDYCGKEFKIVKKFMAEKL